MGCQAAAEAQAVVDAQVAAAAAEAAEAAVAAQEEEEKPIRVWTAAEGKLPIATAATELEPEPECIDAADFQTPRQPGAAAAAAGAAATAQPQGQSDKQGAAVVVGALGHQSGVLMNTPLKQLRMHAEELGVDDDEMDSARDSDAPYRPALVGLILSREAELAAAQAQAAQEAQASADQEAAAKQAQVDSRATVERLRSEHAAALQSHAANYPAGSVCNSNGRGDGGWQQWHTSRTSSSNGRSADPFAEWLQRPPPAEYFASVAKPVVTALMALNRERPSSMVEG